MLAHESPVSARHVTLPTRLIQGSYGLTHRFPVSTRRDSGRAMALKLTYFGFPARGEATRIILTLGKIPFEDIIVDRPIPPDLKSSLPFGQVPILELDDGRVLAQSGAIERYTAKLAGLYPSDPVTAAIAEQWAFHTADILQAFVSTFAITDTLAKAKARQDLLAGKVGTQLTALDKALGKSPFLAGSELSFADITAFVFLGWMSCGDWDGVPTTVLDAYPSISAWFQRVANIEAIKAKYADATGSRLPYKAK